MISGRRVVVRACLIGAAATILVLLSSGSALARQILSAKLLAEHLHLQGNEVIVAGRLVLHGGTFDVHIPSQTRFSTIKGPFTSQIENDAATGDSTLIFRLFLLGKGPNGSLKKMEQDDISDWFDIELAGAPHGIVCPSRECPITIEGELLSSDPDDPNFGEVTPRTTRVSTSDFVFKDVTIDVSGLQSKAGQGDIGAQYKLGTLYYNKDTPGVSQNYGEALKWFRMAADQGYAPAQYSVGNIYFHGLGEPTDFAEGIRWWRLAAENGDPEAQDDLSYYLWLGEKGVPQNRTDSKKWLRRAAEQGYYHAQISLGGAFEVGQDVPQDFNEAYFWYLLAGASAATSKVPGDYRTTETTNDAERVAKHLTVDQITAVKKRVAAWKPTLEKPESDK